MDEPIQNPEINPHRQEPLSDPILRRIANLDSIDAKTKTVWMTLVQELRHAVEENRDQILTGTQEQVRKVEEEVVGTLETSVGAELDEIRRNVEGSRAATQQEQEYLRALAEETRLRQQQEEGAIQELAARSEEKRRVIQQLAAEEKKDRDELMAKLKETRRTAEDREGYLEAECAGLRDELKKSRSQLRDSENFGGVLHIAPGLWKSASSSYPLGNSSSSLSASGGGATYSWTLIFRSNCESLYRMYPPFNASSNPPFGHLGDFVRSNPDRVGSWFFDFDNREHVSSK